MSAVLVERQGGVALVTLNRPEVLNAVDRVMTAELTAAIDRCESSADIRAVVITGKGRAFCAGADMRALARDVTFDDVRHPEWGFAGITSRRLSTPLIAAVNGVAVGGGLEIALCCDVIVAAEGARFGLPEVRSGVFAAGGGVQRLTRRVPFGLALELMLTGRLMGAREAEVSGLVTRVVPEADVVAEGMGIALEIAAQAPLAVGATKRLAWLGGDLRDADVRARTDEEARIVLSSRDAAEGMAAFAEGRAPDFTGE